MTEEFRGLRVCSVPCYNYTDRNGAERTVSAIMVPIGIQTREDGKIVVSWACSLGGNCYFHKCRYSKTEEDIQEVP